MPPLISIFRNTPVQFLSRQLRTVRAFLFSMQTCLHPNVDTTRVKTKHNTLNIDIDLRPIAIFFLKKIAIILETKKKYPSLFRELWIVIYTFLIP